MQDFSHAHRKEVKPSVKYQVIFKHKDKIKYYRQKKLLQNSKQNVDFYKYSPKTLVNSTAKSKKAANPMGLLP